MNADLKMVIKPQFYDEFHCLGGDCKFTCCQGWNIDLSKNEYEKTKKAKKSKELQNIVTGCMQRTKTTLSDKRYAKMKLNDGGSCQLMSKEGLCRLQIECGYGLLSDTCKYYPRLQFSVVNSRESHLVTSCEAVVKLLMTKPEGIELVEGEASPNDCAPIAFHISEEYLKVRPVFGYYWDIKTLGLGILQCTELQLEERIMLLGIAMKRISEFEAVGEFEKIPSFVDHMLHEEIDETALNILREVKPEYVQGNHITMQVLEQYGKRMTKYKDFYDKIVENYGQSENIPSEKIAERFNRLKKFFAGREYILSNVVVNIFLAECVPFKVSKLDIWGNYMSFCFLYTYMMNSLAGYLDEDSTDDDIVLAITVTSRMVMHNNGIIENFYDTMKSVQMDTLAHMAMLVKS